MSFSLDGADYGIDLTEANATTLREALADFVGAARRTGGRIRRSGPSPRSAASRVIRT